MMDGSAHKTTTKRAAVPSVIGPSFLENYTMEAIVPRAQAQLLVKSIMQNHARVLKNHKVSQTISGF